MESGKDYILIDSEDFEGHRMPSDFAAVKQQMENFEVRNSDVWVTSYPKSGTTWCQELVWLIANDLDYEGAKEDLERRFPYIEGRGCQRALVQFAKENSIQSGLTKISTFPDIVARLENIPRKRFIKSHVPWNLLPRQIKNGEKTPKIIHVMRDPKQVAASYYPFSLSAMPIYKGNLEDFVDLYTQKKLPFGNYFNTVLSYWQQRHLPNLLILSYEEMHADITKVIEKVCMFLGKRYSEVQIAKLVDHLGFGRMKSNRAVNKQNFIGNEDVQFMRKGTVDSYKTELNGTIIAKLNNWIEENAKGTGLPYEIK